MNPWHCSKRVADVVPDVVVYLTCAVMGLGGRGVIKIWTEVAARVRLYLVTSDLTSLFPPQFSHWLQVRKVDTVYFSFFLHPLSRLWCDRILQLKDVENHNFLVELALAERDSKNASVFFFVCPSQIGFMLPGVPSVDRETGDKNRDDFHCMQMSLVTGMRFNFGDDWITRNVYHVLAIWQYFFCHVRVFFWFIHFF